MVCCEHKKKADDDINIIMKNLTFSKFQTLKETLSLMFPRLKGSHKYSKDTIEMS